MARDAGKGRMTIRPEIETRRWRRLTAVLVAAALAGCSYVPDWANPVEWYDDLAGDDVPPPPQQVASEQTGTEQPFPQLGTVPERPAPQTTEEQRSAVSAGLSADRDNARYTDEVLRANPNAPPPAPPIQTGQTGAAPATPPPAPPITVGGATNVQPAPGQAVSPPPAPPAVPAPAVSLVSPTQPPAAQAPTTSPTTLPMNVPTAGPIVQPTVSADQQALSQAFQQSITQSAATVITTPTHGGFAATTSQPITAQQSPVNPLIRENYNDSVARQPAAIPAPNTQVAALPGAGGFGLNGQPVAVVTFANGSSKLSKKDLSEISRVAGAHKARGGRVRVIGHASRRTKNLPAAQHKLVNFRLSVDRAQAVAKALMKRGVPAQSIIVEARGAEDPVYHEWMPTGEAQNRRADIYLEF